MDKEGGMACPRCGYEMRIEGIYKICTNPTCTYRYEVPVKMPTLPEALKRIAELEKYIAELEKQTGWRPNP